MNNDPDPFGPAAPHDYLQKHVVLDQGYVQYVTHWGSEEGIIEAARMSTNKGFQGWESDAKLLSYLYRNKHMTPFEMAGLTIEVKAPIFVFREWHRHRVPFSYNEMSARYTPLPDENYRPTVNRCLLNSSTNKQAGTADGAGELTPQQALEWTMRLDALYVASQAVYEDGLALGIPKELARLACTVARYSRMRASSNLRGWLNFLELRQAENAQYEIRMYADAVAWTLRNLFPRTMELYSNGR